MFSMSKEFNNLSMINFYYKLIDKCYEDVYYEHNYNRIKNPLLSCPTHFHCNFPNIIGVNCVQAKQEFFKNSLKNLIIYSAKKMFINVMSKNGCSVD